MGEKHRDSTGDWEKEKRALKNMTTSKSSRKAEDSSPTRKN